MLFRSLIMGCERRVVYDFVNVIQGDCTLKQALIKDKRIETLFVLDRKSVVSFTTS